MASLALFVISSTLTQGFYDFNGGGYGSGYDIGFGKGFGYDKSYPSYNDPKSYLFLCLIFYWISVSY